MKRCPTCNRVETDETLKFCRLDGTLLVAASESESATMALPASQPSAELTTGRLRVTPSIAVLPFANMSTGALLSMCAIGRGLTYWKIDVAML
jgi:hypothetical protein